jgi:hypothetical protein
VSIYLLFVDPFVWQPMIKQAYDVGYWLLLVDVCLAAHDKAGLYFWLFAVISKPLVNWQHP